MIRFIRILGLSLGFAGWMVIAIVFLWVERSGGEVVVHNNRVWPPYEAIMDIAAIALAFAVISVALIYEVRSHLRSK